MKSLLTFVAISLAAQVCSANMLSNSSFETGAIPNFTVLGNSDAASLPGWKTTGSTCTTNCVLVLNTIYTEPSIIGTIFFQSQSGNQSVDISGGGNTLDGGIEQTVAIVVGTTYTLTFYLGNMDDAAELYTGASTARVKITGQSDQLFSNDNNTANHVNWAIETFTFTATSALTTIDFINATPLGDNYVGIDNVQLNAATNGVPEPSTCGLIALGMLGLAWRRGRWATLGKDSTS